MGMRGPGRCGRPGLRVGVPTLSVRWSPAAKWEERLPCLPCLGCRRPTRAGPEAGNGDNDNPANFSHRFFTLFFFFFFYPPPSPLISQVLQILQRVGGEILGAQPAAGGTSLSSLLCLAVQVLSRLARRICYCNSIKSSHWRCRTQMNVGCAWVHRKVHT